MASNCLLAFAVTMCMVGAEPTVDFDTHIVPALTKAGCNVAACHGAAAGRGGFHLSLWGLDPEADYRAVVREFEGRRINLARADTSLLLLKGTGSTEHGGDDALSRAPLGEERLLEWIRGGAERGTRRHLTALRVEPAGTTQIKVGKSTRLKAVAEFDNGDSEEVTRWTVFQANDPSAVRLNDAANTATVTRGGRHVVLARFMDQVIPMVFISPLRETRANYSGEDLRNRIDRHVLETLRVLGLPVSPPADDATFARRIYLDLTGTLPTPDQLAKFLAEDSFQKREALADQLFDSDEFVELWTYRWAKLLRIRSQGNDKVGAATFHAWLRQQVKAGTSYDDLVHRLLTADGDTHEVGPANFYRVVSGAREQAEYVSELLMGARMRCANCHNHPLDRWTQDDYHGLAALFAKVEQGRIVRIGSRGAVSHPRTGEPARPRIPGEHFVDDVADPREMLAEWMTCRENPYFAKAVVNRLWRFMMGRGLIEPTDDVRSTNPPSHPALLTFLAEDFVEHDYDIRHTLRMIVTSATYARSAKPLAENRSDNMFYSHAIVRPLESAVLADAISDVTGVPLSYGDQPLGTRAISLFDSKTPSDALDILGRCSRDESCESVPVATTLAQTLHLINGGLVNDRLRDPSGRLRRMVDAGMSNAQIVRTFYVRALSRLPSEAEAAYWNSRLDGETASEKLAGLEDMVWSLLVCREFVTNH